MFDEIEALKQERKIDNHETKKIEKKKAKKDKKKNKNRTVSNHLFKTHQKLVRTFENKEVQYLISTNKYLYRPITH